MAEALAVVGIVASLAQLGNLGWQIAKRINDYQVSTKGVPSIYREISIQLPQIIDICTKIQKENETFGSSPAFVQVVTSCVQHVQTLDELVSKALPVKGDSAIKRAKKAVASVRLEKRLIELQQTLESYKSALVLEIGHQTHAALRPEIPSMTGPVKGTCYHLPPSQVSLFIGRKKILREMTEILCPSVRDPERPVVVVLCGMGGQGKTQLALEYCRQSQQIGRYNSIMWINAASRISIARSFEEVADHITKFKRAFSDPSACVHFTMETLERWASPCLIIFDNFDHPSQMKNIMDYCPKIKEVGIIFTTRNLDVGRLGLSLDVEAMEEQEAVELLLHHIRRPSVAESVEGARLIAQKLGFLALAIDQAGAYINARKLPLRSFIDHYENRKEHVMKHTPQLWDYRRKLNNAEEETSLSVFSTWELSFREMAGNKVTHESMSHLLTLSAFFSNRHISENIFRAHFEGHDPRPGWMHIFETDGKYDTYKYEDIIAELSNLSLLNSDASEEDAHFSLHPLVRDWIQLRMALEERGGYAIEATHYLTSNIRAELNAKERSVPRTRHILSHIDACYENCKRHIKSPMYARSGVLRESLIQFGNFYNMHGRHQQAEEIFREILKEDELGRGYGDLETLQSRLYLTQVYYNQGRYGECRKMLLEIQDKQELQPPLIPNTLRTSTLLARVCFREGLYSEAVALYQQALSGYATGKGLDQTDTLKIYEDLAMVLRNQGSHEAAIEYYHKALVGYEKQYGPNSFQSLKPLVHLADTYRNQGLYEKTLPLYQKALEGNEKQFGIDHLNTLENMVNLAINLRNLGRYADAEHLFSKALHGIEKILGEGHLDTLRTMMNFAINHHKMGNYTEAEVLYHTVLEGRERVLGLDHHYTWRTVECLADLLWLQGKQDEAERLAQRAMRGSRRQSWNKTRHTQRASERSPERNQLQRLAPPPRLRSEPILTHSIDDKIFPDMEALFLRALHRDQVNLRGNHADMLDTMTTLANVYVAQNRYNEAENLFTQVLEVAKSRYGLEHRDCARLILSLNELNELQGKEYDSGYDGFEDDSDEELPMTKLEI
ncbi:uncharacterized protein BP5553_04236 [Venustampulla echinocandica]|uniref:NB-ARC domain-containing protein n=1 Tax=Venustampulla echinocandica TaxID=2656787 RepID=A0A370TWJ1_9HELO|nr:uncharacterized protein BP5553_04236 [Venustampulla echinocandica]RDL39896.1 hypothetical protein BP5553_04236 [Venustampulla echinocandica]